MKVKRIFCFLMAILSAVLLVVPAMTATTNASAQQLYEGDSYFTHNVGGKLIQRKANAEEEAIQTIPSHSLLYVYGSYRLKSKWDTYGSRSYTQYAGEDGHVLNTGFSGKILPHKRNYHKAVVNSDVVLKDDNGKAILTIPKGAEIEVYCLYSYNSNESVVRYKYDYKNIGHIPNSCISTNSSSGNSGVSSNTGSTNTGTLIYSGDSYFTRNEGGRLFQRKATPKDKFIQEIPKNSLIYVYGEYLLPSNYDGPRSWTQFKGSDGHVLNTGFSGKILPHKRNYHKAVVNSDVVLKDDNGKAILTIPKGAEIEVYGSYTLKSNESVVRYKFNYKNIGHIPNNAIGSENTSSNANSNSSSSNGKESFSDFKLQSNEMFVAITTASLLDLKDTNKERILEIPRNSMIICYGTWKEDTARYLSYWEGEWGTVNSDYIVKLYDIPKGFDFFTSDVYWAIADIDLAMWDENTNHMNKDITKGSLVLVLGKSNQDYSNKNQNDRKDRAVVLCNGKFSTVKMQYLSPIKKSALVSISHQKVFLLDNGKVSHMMDCVTGKPGTPTRVGTFSVKYKDKDTVLTDKKTYWLPVEYWVPFDGEIGFHDNQSREVFGGTIYVKNGSHGCVNLFLTSAQILYDFAYKGMRVDVIR